ncbi:DsbA family protein [Palleronia sp. KMU-117]|uniref:DsbA family protein n=1 Tax=Palleronia sp. KMU-117 TaxID=3434108 RepID=UPI003D714994
MTRDRPPAPSGPPRSRRGALAVLAGLAIAAAVLPPLLRRLAPLPLEPLPGLPGFRRIEGTDLTRAFDPFVGLGTPASETATDTLRAAADRAVRADPCAALFPGWSGDSVPLAVFTDHNCAVCRRTEPEVRGWVGAQGGRVTLFWHDLPLLGPTSEIAARGALAARRLGAEAAFRARLLRSAPSPDPAWLAGTGASLGLDGARLAALAGSPEVDAALAGNLALFQLLGLAGTPGAVLGRTVVSGALPRERWARLLAGESAEATRAACQAL